MEIVGPILGITYFLFQRSLQSKDDEIRKLRSFKEARLKQRHTFQFHSPAFDFNGIGEEIDATVVPTLSKDQMLAFLTNGYLVLKTDLPSEFHEYIYRESKEKIWSGEERSNPGNNVLPLIPGLSQVYQDPQVRGALTSLLGPRYEMHQHRYCHDSMPGSPNQDFHRDCMLSLCLELLTFEDSFFGYSHDLRNPRPKYLMALYYPQDVTFAMGPTACRPGSQYYSAHQKKDNARDAYFTVEAGSVVIMHYDLIHSATRNISNKARFMFKFQFLRMEEPSPAENFPYAIPNDSWNYYLPDEFPLDHKQSWLEIFPPQSRLGDSELAFVKLTQGNLLESLDTLDHNALLEMGFSAEPAERVMDTVAPVVNRIGVPSHYHKSLLEPIVSCIWKWLISEIKSDEALDEGTAKIYEQSLKSPNEAYRYYCAFKLARAGRYATLMRLISAESAHKYFVPAALGLALGSSELSQPALADLIMAALAKLPNHIGEHSAFLYVLSCIDCHSVPLDRIVAFVESSTNDQVSINAMLVLERMSSCQRVDVVPSIVKLMTSTTSPQVRYSAALSLARLGPRAEGAIDVLIYLVKRDCNRYVQGFALTALKRINSPKSQRFLMHYLWESRWDPLTSVHTPW